MKLQVQKTETLKEETRTVGGTGRITLEMFSKNNLHNLKLYCSGSGAALTRAQIIAAISDITVRFDGNAIHEVDSTFLLDLDKYRKDARVSGGDVFEAGVINIPFARPDLASALERKVSSVGLANIKSVTVDVNVISVAVLDKLELFSEVDYDDLRVMGQTVRLHKFNRYHNSTGVEQIADLPFQDADVAGWLAVHVNDGSGAITKVKLKKNRKDLLDDVNTGINNSLLKDAGKAPQSGYFHADLSRSRDVVGFEPMPADNLSLDITWGTAPTDYPVYIERLFKNPAA